MKAAQYDVFATMLGRAGIGFAPDRPASVSDVALETRALVESGLHPLWVRGEISDFKRHHNGHWYFCLRDDAAQIKCVVWSRDQHGLPAPPDDGMQVVLYGQMTIYAARGDLQLKVTRIEAEGDGLWRKAMELTLAKLRKEDCSRNRGRDRFRVFPSASLSSPVRMGQPCGISSWCSDRGIAVCSSLSVPRKCRVNARRRRSPPRFVGLRNGVSRMS